MRRSLRPLLAALAVAGLAAAPACTGPLPVEGAPCPCPASYRCDLASNRCVNGEAPVTPGGGAAPDGGPGTAMDPEQVICVKPGPAPVRRLDADEYAATVHDLLGVTIAATGLPRERGLPDPGGPSPFPDRELSGELTRLADMAASAAMGHLRELLPCTPDPPGESTCARQFAVGFGARAYRRPLTDTEVNELVGAFEQGRRDYGGELGYRRLIQRALDDPNFYLRTESGESTGPRPGLRWLTPWEVATRLSYFLTGTMPDDELWQAASAGGLRRKADVRAQAERLLGSARAGAVIAAFHRRWLRLEDVRDAAKDGDTPAFSAALREDLITSGLTTAALAVQTNRNIQGALFGALVVGNRPMADFYGLSVPGGAGFEPLTPLGDQKRFGILTLPAVLSTLASGADSSPVRRGLFVVRDLLCADPPDPPAGVIPPVPPPSPAAMTTRERFSQHTSEPTCRACHVHFDPIGFGLENYDGYGRWRATENGVAIDASGTGDLLGRPFDGPAGLAELLASSPDVSACLAQQWFRFAMGRAAISTDDCTLDELTRQFEAGGRQLRPLLLAITTSDAFLTLQASQ